MIPAGENILTMPERILLLVLLLVFTTMALRTYNRRYQLIRSGCATEDGQKNPGAVVRFLKYVPGQLSNIRTISVKDLGGAMHLVLFYSAIIFAIYYGCYLVLGDILGLFRGAFESGPGHAFLFLTELMAVLVLVALLWGLVRRMIVKPMRLGPDYEVGLFLFVTCAGYSLFICFFLLGGLRYNLGMSSYIGPVTGIIANALHGSSQVGLFHLMWWVQAAIILCFMLYVPYSDHQHAMFAPFNILLSPPKPRGAFSKLELDTNYKGADSLENFTWKQLLEFYGCAQCGRCQAVCPAYAAGKDLSPKKIINDLRIWMDDTGGIKPFWKKDKKSGKSVEASGRILDSELWSCTTCMACVEACPAFVSSLDKIMDLRRDRVMAKSEFYPEVIPLFRSLENFGDIFGCGKASRGDWAMGRGIKILTQDNEADMLFWVGCQTTFDDRSKGSAVKLAEILTHCGIDLAILGKNESCCGDPFRRLGNEYQYQNSAKQNIEVLQKLRFKRIVTYCPHCYNTLKNEYPQFGADFEVIHYTELFDELIEKGLLKPKSSSGARVVFHDPCYLARGNDLTKGHNVLQALPGITPVALEQSSNNTFCCGGGGGAMWMRESGNAKINELRVKQLVKNEPEVIATSCPYCIVMLDDGLSSLGHDRIQCKDLIELVHETI